MILYPNCKINIGLRVIRKREDGYHDLETIFYPIHGLTDRLEVTASERFSFEQAGIAVDCAADDNLLIKCYRRMQEHYPQIGNVRIRFEKRIPFGAGLGGGSSDAAHMAIALNELFRLGLSREQLADEVSTLGADCAFFIYNTPCLAEGIGERLTPISLSLSGFRLIMLKPDVHVSTREAYQGIRLSGDKPSLAQLVRKGIAPIDLKRHEAVIYNDFERTIFALHPQLAAVKQQLLDAGAFYAAMSGSGSTVYGLFEPDTERQTPADYGITDEQTQQMLIFNNILS